MRETMWSVELADDYNDDTFNGTFEECIKYCEDMEYTIGSDCRLAKILVEDGCVIETLEIVDEIE